MFRDILLQFLANNVKGDVRIAKASLELEIDHVMSRIIRSLRIKRPNGKYVTGFHLREFNRAGWIDQCIAGISQQGKVLTGFPGGCAVVQNCEGNIEGIGALELCIVDRTLADDVT